MPAHERNKLCMVWAAAGQDHVTSECGAREMLRDEPYSICVCDYVV
jgi:hypothetical protein